MPLENKNSLADYSIEEIDQYLAECGSTDTSNSPDDRGNYLDAVLEGASKMPNGYLMKSIAGA